MKALHYNISSGKVDYLFMSIILRISYMLMDKVLLAGDNKLAIYTAETFRNTSLLEKARILDKYFSNREDVDPEFLDNLRSMKEMINGFEKLKHPEKYIIVAYNKMNRNLKNIFNMHVEWLLSVCKSYGLMELAGIIDGDTFKLLFVMNDNSILVLGSDNAINNIFCIKSLKPIKEEEQVIITLGSNFTFSDFTKGRKQYHYSDIEATDERNTYLHNCLRFPIPINMKADELKIVRNYLRPSAIILNEALNQWNKYFTEQENDQSSISFFVTEIIPTFTAVQENIESNGILTSLLKSQTNTNPYIDVWIGEAPLTTIWEYYLYMKMIDDNEYEQLLVAAEIHPLLRKRVPVMIISSDNKIETLKDDLFTPDETIILPSRKSILIND